MKTEIINGKLYYPVDMGDDEGIVYMTKEVVDMEPNGNIVGIWG